MRGNWSEHRQRGAGVSVLVADGMVVEEKVLPMSARGSQHPSAVALRFSPEGGVPPCVIHVVFNELCADLCCPCPAPRRRTQPKRRHCYVSSNTSPMNSMAGNLPHTGPRPKMRGVARGAGRSESLRFGEFWIRPGHPKRESLKVAADGMPHTCTALDHHWGETQGWY